MPSISAMAMPVRMYDRAIKRLNVIAFETPQYASAAWGRPRPGIGF